MSNVDSRVVPTVSIKEKLSDNWNTVPYLWPNRYRNSAAPEVSVANLTYDFGTIKRTDRAASSEYAPLEDLHGQYVRIQTDYEGAVETNFFGVIETVETRVLSNVRKTGRQKITAYGVGHLLDRVPIKTAFVEDANGNGVNEIGWAPAFNRRDRFGAQVFGNRSERAIGDSATHVFHKYPDYDTVDVWTNTDIIRYLLANFAPPDLALVLGGQVVLSSIVEVHQATKWRSLWDALNQLIDRKRGVGFTIDFEEATNSNTLRVFTIAKEEIVVGSSTLPANENQQEFQVPTSLPFVHLVDEIPFKETILNQASKITVRGQRAKATGTFSVADGTLEPGWRTAGSSLPSALYRDALLNADDETPASQRDKDLKRAASFFGGLWTRFVVPKGFGWQVSDGLNDASPTPMALIPQDDGIMHIGVGPVWNGGKKFLRQTPFLVGWDYTVDPPVRAAANDDTQPEFQSMMVFVNDTWTQSEGLQNHRPAQQSYRVDRVPLERVKSVGYRPLDDVMGFEVQVNPIHYFAGDEMLMTDDLFVETSPEFDYQQLVCTATVELDVRQNIIIDFAGASGATDREIVVDVEDAEYWFVAANTAIDTKLAIVANDGSRAGDPYSRVNSGQRMILRDDLIKLEGIAAFMEAWHKVKRQAVRIPIHRARNWIPLGTLITNITSVDEIKEVNTVVTSITTTFPEGADGGEANTTVETGWAALDSATLASRLIG